MQLAKKEFSEQIKETFRDKLKTSGQLRHILAQEKLNNRTDKSRQPKVQNNFSSNLAQDKMRVYKDKQL